MASSSKWPMVAMDAALDMVLAAASSLLPARATSFDLEANPTALLGKVIAVDVIATEPVPGFPASIMDGYAVVAADGVGEYPIVSAITAGADPQAVTLSAGKVSYITTGAPVPVGADAVIPIEDTALSADKRTVTINAAVAAGAWIRPLGSDVAVGQRVLGANEVLSAAELGLLATVGATAVQAYAPPVVGVLSTGDELVPPSTAVSGGKVRDSNRFMLLGAVAEAGGEAVDLGIVSDQAQGIEAAICQALRSVDVLITSGGVSMGSLDLVKPLLERIGTVHFGRLCMKPGKPTTFASVTVDGVEKLVFALPGNPVSSYVTFKLLAHPCILRLRGLPVTGCHHPRVHARLSQTIQLDPCRPEYHRVVLEWRQGTGAAGEFVAHSTGVQRSSRLLSVRAASALLCLPASAGTLVKGTMVPTLLLECHAGRPTVPPPTNVTLHADPKTLALVKPPTASLPAAAAATAAAPVKVKSGCVCCQAGNSHTQGPEPEPPQLMGGHSTAGADKVKIGVLTVSDRASAGAYTDRGGPAILGFIADAIRSPWEAEYVVVADEQRQIESALCDLTDRLQCSIVITTGGTGIGPRDVTPEATLKVLDRELPGFGEQMRAISLEYVPTAILSRQTAGTRGQSLIVNLPGSPRSIGQILPRILDAIVNCVSLVGGPTIAAAPHVAVPAASAATVPTTATQELEAKKELEEFTVDKVNNEWLAEIISRYDNVADASDVVTKLLQWVRRQDTTHVYEKVRGCDRKKVKQTVQLAISPTDKEYLSTAADNHSLPGIDKALRVVLDFALEDFAPADVHAVYGQ